MNFEPRYDPEAIVCAGAYNSKIHLTRRNPSGGTVPSDASGDSTCWVFGDVCGPVDQSGMP